MLVKLVDRLAVTKTRTITDEGYLKATAAITTVGVQQYSGAELAGADPNLDPKGVYNVYRGPDVVFHADTIESAKLKPIQIEHRGDVNADNYKYKAVGTMGETVEALDAERLGASVIITDAPTVTDVDSGEAQVSLGYDCKIVRKAGNYKGVSYEFAFSGGMYINHLAIVPKGRCGETVKILDKEVTTLDREKLKAMGFSDAQIDAILKADGSGGTTPPGVVVVNPPAPAFTDAEDGYGKMMEAMMKDEKMMKRMAEAMMPFMKKKEDQKMDPDPGEGEREKMGDAAIHDAAMHRFKVMSLCDGMLPEDFKPDGKTEKEILVAALKDFTDMDLEGKDESYLLGVAETIDTDRKAAENQSFRDGIKTGGAIPSALGIRKMKGGA